jgi:AraC-like DNA-binding protein
VRFDQEETGSPFPATSSNGLGSFRSGRHALAPSSATRSSSSCTLARSRLVSARIVDSRGDVRPLEAIARELAMSPRTLKRRLAEEGASYTALLEERRKLRSFELLRSDLSVDQVAERLGYSDAANFTRAFRRWTNKTPRQFRSAQRGLAPLAITASRKSPR